MCSDPLCRPGSARQRVLKILLSRYLETFLVLSHPRAGPLGPVQPSALSNRRDERHCVSHVAGVLVLIRLMELAPGQALCVCNFGRQYGFPSAGVTPLCVATGGTWRGTAPASTALRRSVLSSLRLPAGPRREKGSLRSAFLLSEMTNSHFRACA